MQQDPYYIRKLRETLSSRQRINASYSLRAFAKDISIHPSSLSLILNAKRSLPLKDSKKVAKSLKLSPKEASLFYESLFLERMNAEAKASQPIEPAFVLEEAYHDVVAEWEHFAVLNLLEVAGFESRIEFVAKKLNVTEQRAKVVVDHLIQVDLIRVQKDGSWKPQFENLRTTEDFPSAAIHKSHIEKMELGKAKLEQVPLDLRDFSSVSFAVDMESIDEAKAFIREFRRRFQERFERGNKTEVYQLAIQFYPLSHLNIEENKK